MIEHATAALAFELAAQLVPWRQVTARFGISDEQFRLLLAAPIFQKMVREAKAKWDSPMSVAERTRLKAQFALEQCLLPMHGIAQDGKTHPQQRLDAMKLLAGIAGMGKGEGPQPANGFQLTINLGENHQIRVAAPLVNATPEDTQDLG